LGEIGKLVGAVDETNNGEYLSFVVCDHESLIRNVKVFPQNFRHMTDYHGTEIPERIWNNLNFDGNFYSCCIKFDLQTIRELLDDAIDGRNISGKRYRQKTSYRIRSTLNTIYNSFLIQNNVKIDDIYFQVDNKLVKSYLTDSGLKTTKPGMVHKIADSIAYANFKNRDLHHRNIIEKGEEFRLNFINRLRKDIGI
jgi:hypothetical protein